MRFRTQIVLVLCAAVSLLYDATAAQGISPFEYRVLATNKTSTMQKEIDPANYKYRLLATNKTSTMQKEIQVGGQEVVSILRRPR